MPHADPASAHSVLQLQTSDGPLDLWAAKSDAGGVCWFTDFEADVVASAPPPGYGSCDLATPPADGISYATDWTATHPDLLAAIGPLSMSARRV